MSGSMPVLERGIGLDRSWYKLPVLQLDDFADVTPQLLRQVSVTLLLFHIVELLLTRSVHPLNVHNTIYFIYTTTLRHFEYMSVLFNLFKLNVNSISVRLMWKHFTTHHSGDGTTAA